MRLTLAEVVANARAAGGARLHPGRDDPRLRDGAVFPAISPRFSWARGASIFTMGSCFSRSVEEKLQGFRVPALGLSVPAHERPGRPNGILNEYNPGTICQRLEYAARGASFGDAGIAAESEGFIDLLLPEYVTPSTRERLLERRAEVDRVYAALPACDAILVTFELVEAWYDRDAGLYLNRMPPVSALMAGRERYEVHILDADETASLLDRIVAALAAVGLRKILLMVSPVALEATASGWDCVIANSYSKSVLVACASRLRQRHPQVDYFPGYEIVGSAGRACYDADAVHVLDEVVERVAGYLVECYAGRDRGAEGGQESGGTSGPAAPMALR